MLIKADTAPLVLPSMFGENVVLQRSATVFEAETSETFLMKIDRICAYLIEIIRDEASTIQAARLMLKIQDFKVKEKNLSEQYNKINKVSRAGGFGAMAKRRAFDSSTLESMQKFNEDVSSLKNDMLSFAEGLTNENLDLRLFQTFMM